MTGDEIRALIQAFAMIRSFPGMRSVEIIVDDGDGELAELLEMFGGVVGIDGYTRAGRGCVMVSAKRKTDAN